MVTNLKVYISDSFDPYYNLAIEKHLFDNISEGCVLLYLWQNRDTVVIGANQNPWAECNLSLLEKEGGKIARRSSGGGAVFHDLGNLNFTFIAHEQDYNLKKNLEVIKKACSLAGIYAQISGRNDILIEGKKFSGNAFYNSKGKCYHHGTLLINADFKKMSRYLTPSQNKLKAKGVKSVSSRVINLSEINTDLTCEQMTENLKTAFEEVYNLKAEFQTHLDYEDIEKMSREYGSWDFIYKKTAPFETELSARFDFGEITLNLNIQGAIINSIVVYTDSMDYELADKIEAALKGCEYSYDAVFKALSKTLDIEKAKNIAELIK